MFFYVIVANDSHKSLILRFYSDDDISEYNEFDKKTWAKIKIFANIASEEGITKAVNFVLDCVVLVMICETKKAQTTTYHMTSSLMGHYEIH